MLQSVASILIIVDCMQTLEITESDEYEETNPYLGRDPEPESVYAYFATVLAGTWLAADLAPARWRKYFQGMVIGIEYGAVSYNYNLGIRITF